MRSKKRLKIEIKSLEYSLSFIIYCPFGIESKSYLECHGIIIRMLLLLLSHFSHVRLCATPYTAAHQDPPSLWFSRQEYWSGLPFPSPMHACMLSRVSDSERPYGQQPTRFLHTQDSLGKNTGVDCHFISRIRMLKNYLFTMQWIMLMKESNEK